MTQRNPLFDAGKENMTVTLPEPWARHIKARAKAKRMRPASYLRQIIADWYEEDRAKALAERIAK